MIGHRRGMAGETLLTVMILALLLLSGFELARGFSVKHALGEGSATAARQLSLNPAAWTTAVATVQNDVTNNVLGGDRGPSVTVELFDANGSSMDPATLSNAPFGTEFRVRASVAMNQFMPLLGTSSRTVTVEHRMLVERFQELSVKETENAPLSSGSAGPHLHHHRTGLRRSARATGNHLADA